MILTNGLVINVSTLTVLALLPTVPTYVHPMAIVQALTSVIAHMVTVATSVSIRFAMEEIQLIHSFAVVMELVSILIIVFARTGTLVLIVVIRFATVVITIPLLVLPQFINLRSLRMNSYSPQRKIAQVTECAFLQRHVIVLLDEYCSTPVCFGLNVTNPASCNYGKNGTCVAPNNCTCLTEFGPDGHCSSILLWQKPYHKSSKL